MDDTEYQDRVDTILINLEDRIDELALDVDVDLSAGILTLTFEDGSAIILSRQPGNHEIWIAARSGGYHLRFVNNDWFCDTSKETLNTLINRLFAEQSGSAAPVLL